MYIFILYIHIQNLYKATKKREHYALIKFDLIKINTLGLAYTGLCNTKYVYRKTKLLA